MNTYPHLLPDVADLMTLPKEARLDELLREVFIPHDRIVSILDFVEFLRFEPPQSRASGLAITGAPGSGKTFLARMIQRRCSGAAANECQAATRPVVLISLTGARDAKTIYNRLLEALGCPHVTSYHGSDRERMAMHLCRTAKVRMLVVDEVQDLLKVTERQCTIALETIKLLMNELQIPLVALGDREVGTALQRDEHLSARFTFRELPVWKDDAYLDRFLTAYERQLPLAKPSLLHKHSIKKALLEASGGSLSKLVRFLTWAAAYAVEDGTEMVTAELIAKAVCQPPKAAIALRRRQEMAAAQVSKAA